MSGSTSGIMASCNHAAQALLRADPDTAMSKYRFIVSTEIYTAGTIGGRCLLRCEPVNGDVYRLTAKQGHGDWFYPYINGPDGGVGVCVVPIGQPEGTLVVTGGMNGCALQVNRSGNNFYFYHDLNGRSLQGKLTPGEVVCRVEYKDYAGPLDLASKMAAAAGGRGYSFWGATYTSAMHENYLITVRRGGRWKVYISAVLRISNTTIGWLDKQSSTTASFKPVSPLVTPLITSFEDV